jgi:hypothetical protein
MPLLQNNKRYTRPSSLPELVNEKAQQDLSVDILSILETEINFLNSELRKVEEAKSREFGLLNRLNVAQQSLQAFRALEASPEPVQEAPVPVVKSVRKAATKKSATPTQSSIAPEPTVSDTENINLVHDDFATFPE